MPGKSEMVVGGGCDNKLVHGGKGMGWGDVDCGQGGRQVGMIVEAG